jgi:hypothetical protein
MLEALVHESEDGRGSPLPCFSSVADREGFWPAEGNHPIQDVASHQRLYSLRRISGG